MGKETKYFVLNSNLKRLRKRVGLTQEEFAVELKIKRSLLGAYEEHRAEVKNTVIKKCIEKGYLLASQLYEFMFLSSFKPTPTRHYKKILVKEETS